MLQSFDPRNKFSTKPNGIVKSIYAQAFNPQTWRTELVQLDDIDTAAPTRPDRRPIKWAYVHATTPPYLPYRVPVSTLRHVHIWYETEVH